MTTQADAARLTVVVYSDDVNTRDEICTALGRRPAPELPRIDIEQFATEPALVRRVKAGGVDVAILDGEAVPAGGMGICRGLKEEAYRCPPILVITGRPSDAWLATWSRADAVVPRPLDPRDLAEAAAALLRRVVAS
jgi:DNA-binding response OmpR family regulator